MTDQRVQTVGAAWLTFKDTLGPEAVGVLGLAVSLYGKDIIDLSTHGDILGQVSPVDVPGLGEVIAQGITPILESDAKWGERTAAETQVQPDDSGQQQSDLAREEERQRQEADARAQSQEHIEAALAQDEEHARQRADLDAQLEDIRTRFSEAHRDDPVEQQERDGQKLDEIEREARDELAARQDLERERTAEQEREAAEREAAEREREAAAEREREAAQREQEAAEREREAAERARAATEQDEREAAERERETAEQERETARRERETAEREAREEAERERQRIEREAREAAERAAREAAAARQRD